MNFTDLISALLRFKSENPSADKAQMVSCCLRVGHLSTIGPVHTGLDFTFRFAEANTGSSSNTIISLSTIQKHDSAPLILCIVRPDRLDFRLINSLMLKRVSHSSHNLRFDNIRGSINGTDIMDSYDGLSNRLENFQHLFAIHARSTWDENVGRLVRATNSIVARSARFKVTATSQASIMDAPKRASVASRTESFKSAEQSLMEIVRNSQIELLEAARTNSVNLRGTRIENIVTGKINAHRLDAIIFPLQPSGKLIVDIKTKFLGRAYELKAYNIDKMLRILSETDVSFAFFFVSLDVARSLVRSHLISIFDPVIVEATRIQTPWAGRFSRGVTQLTGDISNVFLAEYRSSIDIPKAKLLLTKFIER